MAIPVRETYPAENASSPSSVADISIRVTDDGSRTIVLNATQDTYHSGCGAAAESRHVYLENSGVADAIRHGCQVRILEIGTGTGMTLLQMLSLAGQFPGTEIAYLGLETRVLPQGVVRQIYAGRGQQDGLDPDIVAQWIQWHESPDVPFMAGNANKDITISRCDATQWSWDAELETPFDAIWFDPFSPVAAPALWSRPMLQTMFDCLRPAGRLVSYCVNRKVRDLLSEIGFAVDRVKGPPGGKREVLIARR
ncbi:MAG: MnmC family methyltransferase [Planctomycetota bacterium]